MVYNLADIILGIIQGKVKDGDIFESNSGFRIIYKDGVLCWLTSGGYIGSAVVINDETVNEVFNKVAYRRKRFIEFAEALELIAKGKGVTFIVEDSREYVVDSLDALDEIICDKEYLGDLYNATIFVEDETELVETDEADGLDEDSVRKLTKADVYNIHHLYHFVGWAVPYIAKQYNISERMVYYILKGERWQDVYKLFHDDFDVASQDYHK